MNSTLFSGNYPIDCNLKERLISDCVSAGKTPFIITFDRSRNARDFGAVEISLSDFIPYLSSDECCDCLTEIIGSNTEIRSLMERFVLYFKSYTDSTGIGFLDVSRWSMRSLLHNSRAVNDEFNSFLRDNLNSLAVLENYIHRVARKIGEPSVNLGDTIRTNKAVFYKINTSSNLKEQSVLLKNVLYCIDCFIPSDSGVIFFESIPREYSNIICDFMSSSRFETKIFVADLFVFGEYTKSVLLSPCEKVVFFKHNSDNATQRIAEFIGKHDVNQTSFTKHPQSRRSVDSGMFSLSLTNDISMVDKGHNDVGYSVSKVEKYKLSVRDIENIQHNEAIVVNCSDKSYTIVKCG